MRKTRDKEHLASTENLGLTLCRRVIVAMMNPPCCATRHLAWRVRVVWSLHEARTIKGICRRCRQVAERSQR